MSMFSRLFGNTPDHELRFIEAQRMVLDYARHIEGWAPMPGCIADTTALPHAKDAMKKALLLCIANSSEPRMEEHLKAGYLMLSAYQSGVGEQMLGVKFTELDLEADPLEISVLINTRGNEARKWESQVQAELHELQQDLYALELELTPAMPLSA